MINIESNCLESFQSFSHLALQLKDLIIQLKINLTPFAGLNDNKTHQSLSYTNQYQAIQRLSFYHRIFSSAANKSEMSEKQLLWLALKELGLMPSSDLMNLVDESDYIEVFIGNTQQYRTFNYYNICSYRFDQLETTPWDQLFYREDTKITEQMFLELTKCIENKKIVSSTTPQHTVFETKSPFKNKILYKLKYIAPLKDVFFGREDCFMTIIQADLLESNLLPDRDDFLEDTNSDLLPLATLTNLATRSS